MKFGLLYEMQLPRPIGQHDWQPDAERRMLMEALEQIELADRLGYDYVFVVEHHFLDEFSHSSAPEVFLGAVSQRTRNIRLAHGAMNTVPRVNHPARVAERIATLDLLSNGRVEFGTAESATPMEMGGFGIPRDKKQAMWEEGTREACNMMVQSPYAGYRGSYFSMPERNVLPKPQQRPHPPLWMAAGSKGATLAAAKRGMGAMAFGVSTPEDLADRLGEYYQIVREDCTPIGHAINPAIAGFFPMACAEDEAEALERAEELQFFGYAMMHHLGDEHQPARSHIRDRFNELPSAMRQQMGEGARRSGCIGTPAQIRETMRHLEAGHLDIAACLVQAGALPHAQVMQSIALFGTQVLPEFRERHGAHQAWRAEQLAGVRFPLNSSV